jgi:hypothetical protein
MRGSEKQQATILSLISPDQRAPKDHSLRRIMSLPRFGGHRIRLSIGVHQTGASSKAQVNNPAQRLRVDT